jgi:hypothetical protein
VVGVICYPIVTYFYIVHVLTLQDDSVRHIVVDLAYTCIVTEIELVSDLRVGFPQVLYQ